jgi:hypothetical protein
LADATPDRKTSGAAEDAALVSRAPNTQIPAKIKMKHFIAIAVAAVDIAACP